MKRLTLLTMLVTLLSVAAFAQKGMKMLPFNGKLPAPSTTLQGIDRQAQPVTNVGRRAGGELVTPPATATVETWYTVDGKFYAYASAGWQDVSADMPTVNVAIDGADIYIQGLAYWFKTGWIKGTISGTTATFPSGQFVGEDQYGSEYLCGSDDGENLSENIVFSYDATEGILKAKTLAIYENGSTTEISAYCYWYLPTFSKTAPEKPDVVVLPEGVTAEEFIMSYQDADGASYAIPAKVAVDGNDVYFQGISYFLPETWVKGTKDGNKVTFPSMQYVGDYGTYGSSYAFYNGDAVFTYDAEAGTYAAEGEIFGVLAEKYYDGHYYNPVLKKVVEKAATPANPTITEVGDTQYGPAMSFNVPVVDIEGNGMLSSKLSFQFFVDVEQEVSPLTFKAEYYKNLESDMTVIPYGFTEDYDFYDNQIYLNMPEYSTFNKIGIQSIYTGGGEEHKSEIVWYTIKGYGNAKFNFNAMDVICSSNTSSAGDITEDKTFTAGNVTLTVSPSGGNTPNRFWSTNNGPQLRVYGGTLTFKVPADRVITKIGFNSGKWNNNNSADTGAFDGNMWTGEANKVVVTIAGNTQLNSIDVETAEFVPTPVVAPDGLVTEPYIFSAIETVNDIEAPVRRAQSAYSYQTEVGFAGNDVYIKGLSENTADMWIKATKNAAGKYVIPANQYIGQLSFYGMFVFDYYLAACDEELNAVDVVLDFDAEKNKFTTDQIVVLNGALTEWDPYQIFTDVAITKFVEVAATPADPTVDELRFNASYPSAHFIVPSVGTNGEDLNNKKLFYTIWIEKNGEQQPYTFTAAAYSSDFEEDVTEVPYTHDGWDLYYGGQLVYFEEAAEELSTWSKVGIQTIYYGAGEVHKSNIAWAYNDTYIPSEITVDEVGYATFYDANHSFVIPEGVKAYVVTAATTDQLTYSELEGVIPAGTAVMLEARGGGKYPVVVSEDGATYDGINLLHGSNQPTTTTADVEDCLFYKLAYGRSGSKNANKVGWYWGAENGAAFEIEPHRAWLAVPQVVASAPGYPFNGSSTGISTTLAADSADAVFYDLQGRRVNTPVKGLYIQKNKKVIIK